MKKFWIKKGLMIITCVIAAALLFGFIVMSLWNAILPAVLGVSTITFIQALGILVLSKILFGGFGRGGGGGCGPRGEWGAKMKAKWGSMSPEEKENFKSEWRNKCGTWGRKKEEDVKESPNNSVTP